MPGVFRLGCRAGRYAAQACGEVAQDSELGEFSWCRVVCITQCGKLIGSLEKELHQAIRQESPTLLPFPGRLAAVTLNWGLD